jgi:hypothetical protein
MGQTGWCFEKSNLCKHKQNANRSIALLKQWFDMLLRLVVRSIPFIKSYAEGK